MCAPRDSSVHSCGPRRLRCRMSPSQACPRPSGKGGSQRCRLRHPRRSARFPSRRPKRSCMRSTPHGRAVAARSSSSWAQMAASDARRPEYAGLSLGEAKGKAKRALICRGARAKQSWPELQRRTDHRNPRKWAFWRSKPKTISGQQPHVGYTT